MCICAITHPSVFIPLTQMKTGVEIGPGLATMTIYLLLLIIDGTLVMFNLMQFHSLIRLCSRLFVRFLVLSFLHSYLQLKGLNHLHKYTSLKAIVE